MIAYLRHRLESRRARRRLLDYLEAGHAQRVRRLVDALEDEERDRVAIRDALTRRALRNEGRP